MSASFLDVFNHAIDRYPPIVPPTTVLARAIANLHSKDNTLGDYLLVTQVGDNYSPLLGLLTEREAIAFMASHQDWSDRPVSEAMREAIAYQVSEITSFQQLLSLFRQHHSSVIPLIDREGLLTGTIVREQIWQAMESHLSSFDDRQATQIKLQQTEIALKASESRYWEIIEAQTELICRFLPDSTLTFVNEAYCRYFHSSKRDLIGKPFLFLMPEEEQGKVRQILQVLTPENPVITAEYQALRPDGSIAWQQWTDRAIFDRENNLLEYQAVGRDISDRVFAEEALRRSEEKLRQLNENLEATVRDRTLSLQKSETRFRSLFEQAGIGITLTTLTGQYITANQKFCDLLGYSVTEIIELTWKQLTHPEDLPLQQATYHRMLSGEFKNYSLEQRYLHRNGEIIWLNVTYSVVCDHDNIPQYTLSMVEDIRDRKRAAAQLQVIQERFEYLIASSPAIIYSCSTDSESFPTTFISENVKEILGYSAQDWLQDPNFWFDRLHPEESDCIANNMELLFSLGHRIYEYRFLHQDGNYRWLRDEVKLIRDEEGNPIECVGSIIEISDRKETEAELRKSEERYRAIVQDQTELICRYRADGTLLFVNDAYCRYFQQSRQDIIDRKWLPDILPEDLEKLNQQYSLLRPDHPVYTCEIRTFLPNGTSRIQQWIDRGFFNKQGELIEIQAVGRDISDRKQAENDIRSALEKEKELNELKSNFISIASHEFRTPLTVIIASAKLQKYYSHKLSEEQNKQQLDRILRASDRILQLLNDILILGRAEAGKIEISLAPLNLKYFCLELLTEIKAIDEDRHNIIFRNREKIDRNIIADENLLHYILTNLLSNAIKYSPQNTPVTLNVTLENCEIIFQVEDCGLGIPSEDIPHLFESFHRAKNVGEIKGTGLGLAIVKRAVEIYEGEIDVQSKINEGTIFTITLPLLHEN